MASVSGLSLQKRLNARRIAVNAAMLGVRHESAIHYTQGPQRWQGIDHKLHSAGGSFPTQADCSSFTTWCLWNALAVRYGVRDTVNGADWRYGYTGTQRQHGKPVRLRANWRKGDLIHYGPSTGRHVAILVDPVRGLVVSLGGEHGPVLCKWNYRGDFHSCRRHV